MKSLFVAVTAAVALLTVDLGRADPALTLADRMQPDCVNYSCRASHSIQLRAQDGSTIDLTAKAIPYIDETGVVSLYAGEAVQISFDRNDLSHPKFLRVIDKVDLQGLSGYHRDAPPPDPSTPAILSIELRQEEGKPNMTLTLRNDTGVPLKYDATMLVPTPEGIRPLHTSMCPLFPGMTGYEAWPHPVAMLLLSNFRKADTGQLSCE